VTILLYSSCSSVKYKYKYNENFKRSGYPKKVYIDDQIYELNTNGELMEDQQSYAEITTKDGNQYSGKLIDISYEHITLAVGTDVDFKDRTPLDKDKITIEIPKEEIIFLKIW
jgi:hypothetical protein